MQLASIVSIRRAGIHSIVEAIVIAIEVTVVRTTIAVRVHSWRLQDSIPCLRHIQQAVIVRVYVAAVGCALSIKCGFFVAMSTAKNEEEAAQVAAGTLAGIGVAKVGGAAWGAFFGKSDEVAVVVARESAETLGAEAHIATKPGMPGHARVGVTVDGRTAFHDLVITEGGATPKALVVGGQSTAVRTTSRVGSGYKVSSRPVTAEAARAMNARAATIAENPGVYSLTRNSCATFCRDVLAAGNVRAPWWGNAPSLIGAAFRAAP